MAGAGKAAGAAGGFLKKLVGDLVRPVRKWTGRGATDVARHLDDAASPRLFSRGGVRTNLDVLQNGGGLPRTQETIQDIARRADVDVSDVDMHIVDDLDEARYLDYQDAVAVTPGEMGGDQVRLGPASFSDEETLAATIAHERTHVDQLRSGQQVGTGNLGQLEDEAYASEIPALERFRRAGQ